MIHFSISCFQPEKRRATSESGESEAPEAAAPQPPATAAEVMKQLDDHIGSIYDHYLSTRNCPPDFHGLHEHLYFHHEVILTNIVFDFVVGWLSYLNIVKPSWVCITSCFLCAAASAI